jgi:hypothetical protein
MGACGAFGIRVFGGGGETQMKPLALTDQQLQMVIEAAARIPRWQSDLLSVRDALRHAVLAVELDHRHGRDPVIDGAGTMPTPSTAYAK